MLTQEVDGIEVALGGILVADQSQEEALLGIQEAVRQAFPVVHP